MGCMNVPDLSNEPYAQAVQMSPLVRRVLAHNPSPFSYTGTQTYIVGQGEVAVIDPGPLGDDPAHVEAQARARAQAPYVAPDESMPAGVEGLGYDSWRRIAHARDDARSSHKYF